MIHLLLAVIYLSFISLGLPDSLLGSAWPGMYGELGVPVSYASIIFMIISAGTIVSSLWSERIASRLGTGQVTLLSVTMTAVSLYGFSVSHSFYALCLWAIPYGLGAGSVDASLNHYVALHFASRHMSWLHCMWGIGASAGPYIMAYALAGGQGWNRGYCYVFLIQAALTVILLLSLPFWKIKKTQEEEKEEKKKPMKLKEVFALPGAKEAMTAFFCYCALEQTVGLWAGSYLVFHCRTEPEAAARFAGWFFIGITLGRFFSGFLTIVLNDKKMVRLGQIIIFFGAAVLFAAPGNAAPMGLILTGLGCAPIYPCLLHATPQSFGGKYSQAVFGVEMASAYVGSCLMPPVFGLIGDYVEIGLFPFYLLFILAVMAVSHERMLKKTHSERAV